MRRLAPALLAGALALPPAAAAPEVVVYRCVAADGAVTLQNGRRCPKGQREERRVLEAPTSRATPAAPTAPAPVIDTALAADQVASDASASAASPRAGEAGAIPATPTVAMSPSPAPPVFACRTWDGATYFGDSEQPAPRCAPLQAVGLDGRTATDAQACELRADSCEPVLEAARCDAWADRMRRAEAAIAFPTGDVAAAREELERVRTTIAGTVCAR